MQIFSLPIFAALPMFVIEYASSAPLNTTAATAVADTPPTLESEIIRPLSKIGSNTGNLEENAKDVYIDCTGTPDNCEQDCWAILCKGASRVQ